jgi:hypothetical protein
VSEELRPIDYAGHIPDEDSRDVTSPSLNPYTDPALRCAWYEGYLAAVGIVAAHGQAQLDAILERRSG